MNKINSEWDNLDGKLGLIVRKPTLIDDCPYKTIQSINGRKEPNLNRDKQVHMNMEQNKIL